MMFSQYEEYKGMRVLLMTRVSTPKQEEGYGHPAQEQACREKLIEPLGLKVVRIIRDTYSGLEFEERKALDEILQSARYKEFDLLVVDVLDRLGRKGLERELWRMRLRATGARILTTEPADHADDDTLTGELVRLINGHGSEQEVNNTRRRTMNGRRAKAEGRLKDGTIGPKKVIGQGRRPYGYHFVTDDKGYRIGLRLNYEVIYVDQDGVEWTEVKVVTVIFELAADGVALPNITAYLNKRGIPSPAASDPLKRPRKTSDNPVWQKATIWEFLNRSDYWGERKEFKTRTLSKIPGQKTHPQRATSEAERVTIAVPAIVTKELAERAHKWLEQNKKRASRNNPHPEDALLRAGLAKCGHCGATMTASRSYSPEARNELGYYVRYSCGGYNLVGKCKGCTIVAHLIDDAAWQKVIEVVKDPSNLAESILDRKPEDPTTENRKNINKKLADIKKRKAHFQTQLSELMMEGKLDHQTKEFLMSELHQLNDQEQQWTTQLAKVGEVHDKWKKVQDKLEELRNECARMREHIHDPNYTLSYKTKRDFVEYLGITAIVWRPGHKPHFKIECNPPDIATLIASTYSGTA